MDLIPELQVLILLHIADIHTWICASEVCGFWHSIVHENMRAQLMRLIRWNSLSSQFQLSDNIRHGIGYRKRKMFNPETSRPLRMICEPIYMYDALILTNFYDIPSGLSAYGEHLCSTYYIDHNTIDWINGKNNIHTTYIVDNDDSYGSIEIKLYKDSISIKIYTSVNCDYCTYTNNINKFKYLIE